MIYITIHILKLPGVLHCRTGPASLEINPMVFLVSFIQLLKSAPGIIPALKMCTNHLDKSSFKGDQHKICLQKTYNTWEGPQRTSRRFPAAPRQPSASAWPWHWCSATWPSHHSSLLSMRSGPRGFVTSPTCTHSVQSFWYYRRLVLHIQRRLSVQQLLSEIDQSTTFMQCSASYMSSVWK